ncbi:MAG: SAM-dependent DNA methyltransferase [Candidatus Heimdallarchaeota archaeon]|nr:MAG: SAM-dependent DNA methyltransferase [Candidatus Heimdallarchaeota archaeon]
MKKSEDSSEERVQLQLIEAVNRIEPYTKKIGYKRLEKPLGFFFARVLDNKVTSSEKGREELERASIRVAAFIIVSQILFYLILKQENEKILKEVNRIQSTKHLQSLFDDIVVRKHYKVIYQARLVEMLPTNSVTSLNQIFQSLSLCRLEEFQSDIIGKIFHGLIPFELRKFLAAYYTSNTAGDFLGYLVIRDTQIKILDPACGSGTLLVSAYKRIKELNGEISHTRILQNLFGFDVAAFAAQLAGINLALQEPLEPIDKCQIGIMDFFKLKLGQQNKNLEFSVPKFDVIIGNPPFTRGDRLDREYKDFLETHLRRNGILLKYNKKYLGLYAYFLLDSLRFLKDQGTLAFILPFSVINSLTMKPVMQYLSEKFSFRYFITSDVQEAFSEQSAFKEVFLVAQKGKSPSQTVKFVILKQKLSRKNYLTLVKRIEEHNEDFEDKSIRIRHITNQELRNSSNWVINLFNREFNDLFELVMESDALTVMNQIVKTPRYDVDRGLRAGISDFFYLPNKYWKISEESKSWIKIEKIGNKVSLILLRQYLYPVFRKSSLYQQIKPDISEYIIVISDKDQLEEGVQEYVQWGSQKFQKQPGFETLAFIHVSKGRKIARVGVTHELSLSTNNIIAYYSPEPAIFTDNFIFIRTYDEEADKTLAAYLNSSLFLLTYFVLRRVKSGALGQIFGTDMRNFFCLNPHHVSEDDREELFQIFDRFAAESSTFPPFLNQIQDALGDKDHPRFHLDRKICEILKLKKIPNFMRQLYETLIIELNKY